MLLAEASQLMQAEEVARWEAKHKGEARKLRRERELLDRQTSALARLPSANERREVGADCLMSFISILCRLDVLHAA